MILPVINIVNVGGTSYIDICSNIEYIRQLNVNKFNISLDLYDWWNSEQGLRILLYLTRWITYCVKSKRSIYTWPLPWCRSFVGYLVPTSHRVLTTQMLRWLTSPELSRCIIRGWTFIPHSLIHVGLNLGWTPQFPNPTPWNGKCRFIPVLIKQYVTNCFSTISLLIGG